MRMVFAVLTLAAGLALTEQSVMAQPQGGGSPGQNAPQVNQGFPQDGAAGQFAPSTPPQGNLPTPSGPPAQNQFQGGQPGTGGQPYTAYRANGSGPEQWRYRFHNGEWWYWLPENRWVIWRNGQWIAYDANTYQAPGVETYVTPSDGGYYGGYYDNGYYPYSNYGYYPYYGWYGYYPYYRHGYYGYYPHYGYGGGYYDNWFNRGYYGGNRYYTGRSFYGGHGSYGGGMGHGGGGRR